MLQVKEEKSKVKEEAQEPQTEQEIKTEKQVGHLSSDQRPPPPHPLHG